MAIYMTIANTDLTQNAFNYVAAFLSETGNPNAVQTEISLTQLDLVLEQLQYCYFNIGATSGGQIRIELRDEAWSSLNLPPNHPVKGLYVAPSSVTSGGTTWQPAIGYRIYPTLSPNGTNPPNFAYAKTGGAQPAFVHAAISALLQ